MRNTLKNRLGRASAILVIAGLALVGAGSSADARDGHWGGHGYYRAPHHAYHHWYRGWYRPYYYAPPLIVYPPVVPPAYGYYGPPSLNFGLNVPL
jgi:hypothetical protein